MAYSGDPTSSRQDEVRFLLQDIGDQPLLTDDEIDYVDTLLRASFDDALMTAAFCADIVAGRYASEVSISADGVSIATNELADRYRALAASLRTTYRSLRGLAGVPLVGGIDAFSRADPSVRPLMFGVGMTDNDRAGTQFGNPYRTYNGAEFESGDY